MTGTIAPPERPAPGPPTRVSSALTVIGVLIVAVVLAVTAVQWALAQPVRSESRTVALDQLSDVDVTVSGVHLTVEFGGTTGAQLDVSGEGGIAGWRFERDGSSLVVASPQRSPGPFDWLHHDKPTAVLTLPFSLSDEQLNATVSVDAGDLTLTGAYDRLSIEQDAGTSRVTASANDVTATVDAGDARLDLVDVGTATFALSAGELRGSMTGQVPDRVGIDVSAGSMSLQVPTADYAVTSRVSAGDLSDGLSRDPASPQKVDVQVSAGSVALRPGG